ncbi:hypothetical protein EDS67_15050 [candidate division KSB1 bacterium]|nr:MAG: hypothetical protein EDS67_15050 [candidate division KSB1 bacterium]
MITHGLLHLITLNDGQMQDEFFEIPIRGLQVLRPGTIKLLSRLSHAIGQLSAHEHTVTLKNLSILALSSRRELVKLQA